MANVTLTVRIAWWAKAGVWCAGTTLGILYRHHLIKLETAQKAGERFVEFVGKYGIRVC